jgi:hypothetical protein
MQLSRTFIPRCFLSTVLFIVAVSFMLPSALWAQSSLEGPEQGSVQSGITLIRGWVCTANLIEIQIDNAPRLQAAYGTTRADTQGVCNDQNNGFGLTWNWNLVGDGTHRVRAFADNVLFGDVTFTVSTFGTEFLSGASGTCTLSGFPHSGDHTTVEWDETIQNFVVLNFTPKPPVITPPPSTCCKICTTGKPCGNTCININFTCNVGPGCAC